MTETAQNAAFAVQAILRQNGYQAYLVGGCVRDMLLGRVPKDYDVTTDATPDQVIRVFPKTIPVGAAFGVVVVMQDGVQIEVATFRADGEYSDARRPDSVSYSQTAKEDVIRRDFTINGLLAVQHFYGVSEDKVPEDTILWNDGMGGDTYEITDYVGGFEDIKAKVIRAIGDPVARFTEDALRMLRAVRFAAQLGFEIESKTETAILNLAPTITKVSKERIAAELMKLVSAPFPVKGLVPLVTTGLGRYVLPYLEDFATTLRRFTVCPTTDPLKGLAMLCADSDYEQTEYFLQTLKLSSEQTQVLEGALKNDSKVSNLDLLTLAELKKLARKPGIQIALDLLQQEVELGAGDLNPEFANAVRLMRTFTPEELRPQPLVTGFDLISMGLTPGPIFTKILGDVETKQLDEEITDRETALEFIRQRVER